MDEQKDFRQLLEADPKVMAQLTPAEMDDAFDYHWHLIQVQTIFDRVFK